MPTRNQIDELKHMLAERDVKFVFKNGTKHDRLEYKVDGKNKWITLSCGTTSDDIRAHKNTISDLARQIGHLPVVKPFKVGNIKKTNSLTNQLKDIAVIKFGIRKNGELSLSLPAREMNPRIKGCPRITLKISPENRLVLAFSDVLGRKPSVHNDTTLVYCFSRSTVPFKYRLETIHGSAGPQLRFKWNGNKQLVATGPIPESILPASQRTEPIVVREIEEKLEPVPRPLNQNLNLDVGFIFSNDLVKDGRDLKDLLTDWLQRMKASGSEATIITVDGEVKISMMVKAEL